MSYDITRASSIQDLIEIGYRMPISHGKLHFHTASIENNDKIIINYQSIVDRYADYLNKIIVDYTFTDEEYLKYRFQPKLLSQDMYNTIELWSLILRINNIVSVIGFDKQKIKLFTEDIFDVLNEILIMESDDIRDNAEFITNI